MALAPFVDAKHSADDVGNTAPVLCFSMELLPARLGDGIEAGFAIVVGSAPLGADPPFVEEPDKRGVDRSLIDLQRFLADLLNAARDAVAVERAHGGERFQNHEVESALENFGLGIDGHELCVVLLLLWDGDRSMTPLLWHGNRKARSVLRKSEATVSYLCGARLEGEDNRSGRNGKSAIS